MRTRTVVAAVAMLLLAVVAGIQLADPQFRERTPPEVDFSEPPAEVAADAATQFEYVDYAYRIDIADNRSGEWQQVRTMRIDHSDREYYKTGPIDDRGVVLYGTDAVTFVRPGETASWRVTPARDTLYSADIISQPFLTKRLQASNASVVSENSSQITIRVDTHPLTVARYVPGNATLHINKSSGLIEHATVTYDLEKPRTRYLRFRLTERDVDVERPDGIGFSSWEVVWDVLRGPIVNL